MDNPVLYPQKRKFSAGTLSLWLDNISFLQILFIWIFMILIFGAVYHFGTSESNYLVTNTGVIVHDVLDQIYYSFVTVTTTGFGDIVPKGTFKILSIIEVVFGLLLFAIGVSKLISIKQDVLLNEVYELSFIERISSVRSAIILFKQNIDRTTTKVEENTITKRELNQLHLLYLPAFEYALLEINYLLDKKDSHFTKKVDPVRVELLLNSMMSGFVKISELLDTLHQKKKIFAFEHGKEIIQRTFPICDSIFKNVEALHQIPSQKLHELLGQRYIITGNISNQLGIEHSILNI